MATRSRAFPNQNHKSLSSKTTIYPSFIRKVCLYDWWLVKADMDSKGRRLGVGGFASRESQGIRVFHSAAIAKRHDPITLETVDGITITITDFLNRSLSHGNGFPSEVCNHFLFGFPTYWEEYAARCFDEESTNMEVPSRISSLDRSSDNDGANSFLPTSLDNLPVTWIRDLLICTHGESENHMLTRSIFNDILQKCGADASESGEPSVHPNKGSNKTPSNGKRTGTLRHDSNVSHATISSEEKAKVEKTPDKSAARRSTRQKNLSDTFSTSDASGKQYEGIQITRNASNVCHGKSIGEEAEFREIPDKSIVRRSKRLKNLKK